MSKAIVELTWDDVSSVHCVVIFDEAKAIHELHLGNSASSMCFEVFLDIFLCNWIVRREVSSGSIEMYQEGPSRVKNPFTKILVHGFHRQGLQEIASEARPCPPEHRS